MCLEPDLHTLIPFTSLILQQVHNHKHMLHHQALCSNSDSCQSSEHLGSSLQLQHPAFLSLLSTCTEQICYFNNTWLQSAPA